MRGFNIALESYSILICLILLFDQLSHVSAGLRNQRKWFLLLLAANIGMAAGDLPDWALSGQASALAAWTLRGGTLLLYVCSALLTVGLTGFLIATLDLRSRASRNILRISVLICGVQIALSVLSMFTGSFFAITPDNVYHRGPLHLLSQLLPALTYPLDLFLITECRDRVSPRGMFFLGSFIALPILGQVVQARYYGIAMINPMVTVAIIFAIVNIQREQELEVKAQEKELTELRVEIMLSQIRPHFLYNTLTAIRRLCDVDPARAKQSILDFSRFLRANMDSLSTREPIPFAKELEHTKSYLNLEQQRFGDRLKVVYDIPVTEFEIPTLTLQPVVENAVRHGIMRREEGGTVRVATEEWGDGYVVIVADDGVGMEASAPTDDRSHIGLANVRSRLETQCGGTLLIHSTEKGTTVNIWLPKGKES